MQDGEGRSRGWTTAAALAAGALVLHLARWELIPFVLAAILGFVLDPPIRWLQRRTGAPRWAVASALFAVLLAAGAGMTVAIAADAAREAAAMATSGPGALHQVLQKAFGPGGVKLFGQVINPDSLTADIQGEARQILNPKALEKLAPPAFAVGIGLVALVFLSFYAMVSGPKLARGVVWLAPPSRRAAIERVLPQMTRVVQRYFAGVIVIAAATAALAWLGYGLVLHVQGALLLSLAVGVLETVPAVGPAVAAVLVAMAALQLHSLASMGLMAGYALALRLFIDDLMAPIVLGRSVSVHPVVVMLAYLLGAVLFGVVGVLLAVPAAACLRIALEAAYEDGPG